MRLSKCVVIDPATGGAVVSNHPPFEDIGAARARLLSYVVARCGDRPLAEDITQDAIVKVLQAHSASAVREPMALAYRIADNLLIDHQRRVRRRPGADLSPDLAADQPTLDQVLEDRAVLEAVRRALKAMPAKRREILLRRRYDGQSCQEIARSMGLSVKAVEKHITRGLQHLSVALERREVRGEVGGSQ